MKTTYKFVDREGNEFKGRLEPYVDHKATMVDVSYWPNTDPEDPSEDEMRVTVCLDSLEP